MLRRIERDLPKQVLREAEQIFLDRATGYRIAVATVFYRDRQRLMMVAFEETDREIIAVTAHPLDEADVEGKVKGGRWVR